MISWPELRTKQIENYFQEGEDWHSVAREMIFPNLEDRMPAMVQARQNLFRILPKIFERVNRKFGFEQNIICIIYVGIGCGAGWVTTYDNETAILFGLENIAECSFENTSILEALTAHEFGHVIHFSHRKAQVISIGQGPWWQLYSEGFAQRCEHMIMNKDTWHMQINDQKGNWLNWCQKNLSMLASRFVQMVDQKESVNDFFGSWYDIRGHRQTGYFLGHEAIKLLEKRLTINEVALLESDAFQMRSALETLVKNP